MKVLDVLKAPNGQHVHFVEIMNGTFKKGDNVTAEVDQKLRTDIIRNHTATHLLHQALKDILGEHVNQAGSLVAAERLRFDFSHFGAVSEDELAGIEAQVNQQIWANQKVNVMIKSLKEAKEIGAMALFGEKYGESVRVVKVGEYSLELCGGCHVNNSAEIGLFKIVSESSIGAGIRRIEAVTGKWAYNYLNQQYLTLKQMATELKTSPDEVNKKIGLLQITIKELQRENESLKTKLGNIETKNLVDSVEKVYGINLIRAQVAPMEMENLRNIVDDLKAKLESGIILLATVKSGKVNLVTAVSDDLIRQGFHAGKLIKEAASRVGGGGGGRPDMAQAGGKQPENIQNSLNYVTDYIKSVKISV